MKDFTELHIPTPVGAWVISPGPTKTVLPIYRMPSRFHRFMTTLLLGWEWRPAKSQSKPTRQEDYE
jgi:hypothetical protein